MYDSVQNGLLRSPLSKSRSVSPRASPKRDRLNKPRTFNRKWQLLIAKSEKDGCFAARAKPKWSLG